METFMADGGHEQLAAISKVSRRVALRPINRSDYPRFFAWRSDADNFHLWSSRRKIPSFEQFVAEFEADLLSTITLLAVRKRDLQPIGFVQAYNLNQADGWAYFLEYLSPEHRVVGLGAEAIALFGEYLFACLPLRKVYADVHQFNAQVLESLQKGGFEEEGRSKEHTWYRDRYWDLVHLALTRSRWEDLRAHLARIIALEHDIDRALNGGASTIEELGPAASLEEV